MRVILLTEFFRSGQSTHVFDLAVQLKRRGYEPWVLVAGNHAREYYDQCCEILASANVQFAEADTLPDLMQIGQSISAHIIHVHSSTLFSTGAILARAFCIPLVVTAHGLGLSHQRYRRALTQADCIIAVGRNTAKELQQVIPPERLRIIANGIDIQRFQPAKKEEFHRVVYFGRYERTKIDPLLALSRAVQGISRLSLEVYSDRRPNTPIRAKFRGWCDDPAQMLRQTNVVAACGRSAREALACGNAVLLMNRSYDGLVTPREVTKKNFDFSGSRSAQPYRRIYQDLRRLRKEPALLGKLQDFGRSLAIGQLSSEQMTERIIRVYAMLFDKTKTPNEI